MTAEPASPLAPDPPADAGALPDPDEPGAVEATRRSPAFRPSRRSDSAWTARFLAVGAIVFVAGICFAVGRTTASAETSGRGTQASAVFPAGSGAPGAGRPGGGAVTIEGTVESVADGTITVRLTDGSTVEIATNAGTTYHGQQAASQSDVAAGQTVTVQVDPVEPSAASSGATASGTAPARTATDVTITGQ